MAEPMTSARSQAAIAISHSTHEHQADRPRIMVATGLRQIAARHDAQLERQVLQQDRHEVRDQHHRQQRVAELRAAGQVRGPVARDPCIRRRPSGPGPRRPAACARNPLAKPARWRRPRAAKESRLLAANRSGAGGLVSSLVALGLLAFVFHGATDGETELPVASGDQWRSRAIAGPDYRLKSARVFQYQKLFVLYNKTS